MLAGKLSSISYAMRILTKACTMDALRAVYFAYIHSIIAYGIPFWGNSTKSREIFILQKKILKIIKQIPVRTCSKSIFKDLNILPLPCIYILETVCFIHNNKQFFIQNDTLHTHNTRIAGNLHLTHHNTNKSINSISHKGIIMYNHLPNYIKPLNPILFKKKVKNMLMHHKYFSVEEYLASETQQITN